VEAARFRIALRQGEAHLIDAFEDARIAEAYVQQAEDDARAIVLDAIAISVRPAKEERDNHEALGGTSWRHSRVLPDELSLVRAYGAMQAQQDVHRVSKLNLATYLRKRATYLKQSGESAPKPAKIRTMMEESKTTPLGAPKKPAALARPLPAQASVPRRRGNGMLAAAAASIDEEAAQKSLLLERAELVRRLAEVNASLPPSMTA
jgi:hypothetical protein